MFVCLPLCLFVCVWVFGCWVSVSLIVCVCVVLEGDINLLACMLVLHVSKPAVLWGISATRVPTKTVADCSETYLPRANKSLGKGMQLGLHRLLMA